MGFKLNRTYVLEFEGELQGAIVKIRATPAGVLAEIRDLDGDDVSGLARLLAGHITEWNLEDAEGEPVKITEEGILQGLEVVVMLAIAREWYRAAAGISAPLDVRSTNIAKDLEKSIPMELPEGPLPN